MKLKRNILIEIDKGLQISQQPNEDILNTLNQMEEIINNSEFESDDRFHVYGRRKFLIEEFDEKINEKGNARSYIDAYYDISDFINFKIYSAMTGEEREQILQSGLTIEETEQDLKAYLEEGIICLEEKDIIFDMIKRLKKELKNLG